MTDLQTGIVLGICIGAALVSSLFMWASRRAQRQGRQRPDTQGYQSELGIW